MMKPNAVALTCLIVGATVLSGCQRLSLIQDIRTYERTLDRYAQVDTTETDVTETRHADGREASLISAFFGLDNAMPRANSNRVVCEGAGGADGMPVIFSHEVDIKTLEPGDFEIRTQSGSIGRVTCLTLAPADDPGELRTVLLTGAYGSAADQPVSVEIVGDVLSVDNTINFKGARVDAVALEDGPSIVWAERVPETLWELGSAGTRLPWGGGDHCPVGTRQVLRVAWNGGVTKPGGDPVDDVERQLYQVEMLSPDGSTHTLTPFALADLGDGDNNHLLCLDSAEEVRAVTFPAGHVTDPREDLNPDTTLTRIHR